MPLGRKELIMYRRMLIAAVAVVGLMGFLFASESQTKESTSSSTEICRGPRDGSGQGKGLRDGGGKGSRDGQGHGPRRGLRRGECDGSCRGERRAGQ